MGVAAHVRDVRLVKENGNGCVDEDEAVRVPVGQERHGVCLFVDGHRLF